MNNRTSRLRQIRASAGSGKTYELTSSFLSFLAGASNLSTNKSSFAEDEYSWSGVLAITFTNRAATEMKERIVRRLKETALGKSEAAQGWTKQQASSWLSVLLRNYGSLNVRTIDSLLHMIIRLAALELRLPPDFQPVFSNSKALSPLLDELLEETKHNKELYDLLHKTCSDVFFHSGHSKFTMGSALREAIASNVFQLAPVSSSLATSEAIAEKLQEYRQNATSLAKDLRSRIDDECLCVDKRFLNFLEKPVDARRSQASTTNLKNAFEDYVLASSKNAPSQRTNALYKKFHESIERLRTQGEILKDALSIAPYLLLSREILKRLPSFFFKQKILPTDIIPSLVQKVLSGPYGASSAFCRLGSNLRHILIDEFQDTSREQWTAIRPLIVEALSQGGSLSWVGDVKQAIYGWRGGDASLFDEILLDQELKAIAPNPQTDALPINWRSSRVIVTTNNAAFGKLSEQAQAQATLSSLLPKNAPPEIKASALAEEVPILMQTFKNSAQSIPPDKSGGYVLIRILKETPSLELDDLIRKKLIQIVQEVSSRRPFGDIAILTRKNAEAAQVAQQLMLAEIPVVTENSFLLSEHPVVVQLAALLKFLDAPENDLAFWTVITGGTLLYPLFDVSLERLDEWACAREKNRPLYAAFKRSFPSIWENWIDPFRAKAGLLSPYDAIQEAIERFHIYERFPKDAPFVRRFLETLHTASLQGFGAVAAFLNHWEQHGGEEKTPMPENINAVRVMTTHKSKGLQFPVVIVPWRDFSVKPEKRFVQANVDGLNILTKNSKAMGKEYYKDYAKKAREGLHLLYVAWTRAEEELYPILAPTPKGTFSKAVQSLLEDFFKNDEEVYEAGEKPRPVTRREELNASLAAEKPSQPKVYPPTSPSAHRLPRLRIYRSPLHELAFTNKRRGSLLHYCLQSLRLSGDPKNDVALAVKHGFKRFPLPLPKDHAAIAEEFADMLLWYVELPQTPYWIKFGTPEQSLIDADGTIRRVDLIVDDGDRRVVIEYKTGDPSMEHRNQLARYVNLIKKTSTFDVRGVLIYFDLKKVHTF